jgi:hypothetical protein
MMKEVISDYEKLTEDQKKKPKKNLYNELQLGYASLCTQDIECIIRVYTGEYPEKFQRFSEFFHDKEEEYLKLKNESGKLNNIVAVLQLQNSMSRPYVNFFIKLYMYKMAYELYEEMDEYENKMEDDITEDISKTESASSGKSSSTEEDNSKTVEIPKLLDGGITCKSPINYDTFSDYCSDGCCQLSDTWVDKLIKRIKGLFNRKKKE